VKAYLKDVLTKQTISIVLNQGIDNKVDEKLSTPGTWVTADNGFYDGKKGTFQKRRGHQALSNTVIEDNGESNITNLIFPSALAVHGQSLLAFTSGTVASYSPAAAGWSSQQAPNLPLGSFESVTAVQSPLHVPNRNVVSPNITTYNSDQNTLAVWTELDSLGRVSASYYRITDATSNAFIVSNVVSERTQGPVKVHSLTSDEVGASAVVLWNSGSDTYHAKPSGFNFIPIKMMTGSTTSHAHQPWDSIASGSSVFLATVATGSRHLVVSRHDNLGGNQLTEQWRNESFGSSWIGTGSAAPITLCLQSPVSGTYPECVWVLGWSTSQTTVQSPGDLYAWLLQTSDGDSLSAVKLYSGSASEVPTGITAVFEPSTAKVHAFLALSGTADQPEVVKHIQWDFDDFAGSDLSEAIIHNTWALNTSLQTQAYTMSGTVYVGLGTNDFTQPTFFWAKHVENCPVWMGSANQGRQVPRTVTTSSFTQHHPGPSQLSVVSSSVAFATSLVTDLEDYTVDADTFTARASDVTYAARLDLNLDPIGAFNNIAFQSKTFFASSLPSMFDGTQFVEAGFLQCPESASISCSLSSGNIIGGAYQYKFTYQWTDAQGILWESDPSIRAQLTLNNNAVTFRVPCLHVTNKTNVIVAGYRTRRLEDLTSSPYQFYKFAEVTSSIDQNFTTLRDNLTDFDLTQHTPLYAASDFANFAWPTATWITTYRNRLVLVGYDGDPNLVWFSKTFSLEGRFGFNESLTVRIDDGAFDNSAPTCASPLDQNLVIFKEDSAYALQGDGPTNSDTLAIDGFPAPTLIQSSIGCTQPKSLVATDQGLYFFSRSGIYLLTPGLQFVNIGSPVWEDFKDFTVSSAVLLRNQRQLRWTFEDTDQILVCDYEADHRWHTHSGFRVTDSVVYKGDHILINGDTGAVLQEDANLFTDTLAVDGEPQQVSSTLETGFLRLSEVCSVKIVDEIKLLGKVRDAGTVTVVAYFNDDLNDNATRTFDVSELGKPNIATFKVNRRCESLKIKVYDTPVSGSCFDLTAIQLGVRVEGTKTRENNPSFGI
jgi:hypothetical protein